MTAEQKDLFGRVVALARHYRTAGSYRSFETGIRQALSGGDEAPLLAAAALSRCFRPGNEADIEFARLRREVRAAEAAARAARRTGRRKTRRARRAALSSPGACPAAEGEAPHPGPPTLALLPTGAENRLEEQMGSTFDTGFGTAPLQNGEHHIADRVAHPHA